MDYEKKYNEALERAKDYFKANQRIGELEENDMLSDIFPELKESEDEKIRKGLIEYFKDFRLGTFAYLEPKKILAWLEKQGTSAKLSEEEQNRFAKGVLSSCALSFIDYLDAHKYEGKMCVSNGECEDIENAFHNAMWDRLHRYYCKYIEKRGEQIPANSAKTCKDEQKPAENEELTEFDKAVGVSIGTWNPKSPEQIQSVKAVSKKLLKLAKKQINDEQKPAEWSEEDRKNYQMLQKIICDSDITANLANNLSDWLKDLKDRVQPQYAWKPSDEQMQCLYDAIEHYQTNGYPATKLKELYEQMQKIYKL